MDTKNLNIPGLASAGAMLLGAFLPWAKVSFFGISDSANALEMWYGILFLLLALATGGLMFLKMKYTIYAAAGAALMTLIGLIDVLTTKMVSLGFGLIIALLATGAAIYFSLELMKTGKDDFKEAIDEVQGDKPDDK